MDSFSRFEERLEEYGALRGTQVEPSATTPQGELSQRIQRPLKTSVNQHRMPKGVASRVQWRALSQEPAATTAAIHGPPISRVGMSLTRLGSGSQARIVLFGGFEGAGEEVVPSSNAIHAFWPAKMRWCSLEERGMLRGRPPAPRAGHTASAIDRHQMVVFGGRGAHGLQGDTCLLRMSRATEQRTVWEWIRPRLATPSQPCARAYHAVADIGDGALLLFGGETIMSVTDRDKLIYSIEQVAKKVRKATAMSVSVGISVAALESSTLPALPSRERTDFRGAAPLNMSPRQVGTPRPHSPHAAQMILARDSGLSSCDLSRPPSRPTSRLSTRIASRSISRATTRQSSRATSPGGSQRGAGRLPAERPRTPTADEVVLSTLRDVYPSLKGGLGVGVAPGDGGGVVNGDESSGANVDGHGQCAAGRPSRSAVSRPATHEEATYSFLQANLGVGYAYEAYSTSATTSARRQSPRAHTRPTSPPDRLLTSELLSYRPSKSAFTMPTCTTTPQTADSLGAQPAKDVHAEGTHEWVHHPTTDLWKLTACEGGMLEWRRLVATGTAPFPRSRHVFVAVPERQIALVFGGRSIKVTGGSAGGGSGGKRRR